MSRDTWYKCDPSDLLDAFVELADPNLVAIYTAVINRIYQSGGPISNSEAHIGSLVGMKPRKARASIDQLVAVGKLYIVDGKLMQRRCATELARRNDLSEVRAKAGSSPRKTSVNDSVSAQSSLGFDTETRVNDQKTSENREVRGEEMAENRQAGEAIAPSRARAFAETDKREEETSPTPPQKPGGYVTPRPDFDEPIAPAERGSIVQSTGLGDCLTRAGLVVDLPKLISRIMQVAEMVRPPDDTVLVRAWIKAGADPETDIIPIVTRLAGTSRSPIRGFRYFHNEILTVSAAKQASEDTNIAHFDRVRRRATGS